MLGVRCEPTLQSDCVLEMRMKLKSLAAVFICTCVICAVSYYTQTRIETSQHTEISRSAVQRAAREAARRQDRRASIPWFASHSLNDFHSTTACLWVSDERTGLKIAGRRARGVGTDPTSEKNEEKRARREAALCCAEVSELR